MKCDYWYPDTNIDGGYCDFHKQLPSFGTCAACKYNTAPATWPASKERYHQIQKISRYRPPANEGNVTEAQLEAQRNRLKQGGCCGQASAGN